MTFGSGPVLNNFRTLAHHPKLLKRWLVFGSHILGKYSLSPRDRELAILRVGWLCKVEYEWAQHHAIALDCEIEPEEIERVARGPGAPGWTKSEVALLTATTDG